MPNTREKLIELISKWDVVNKLIQLENNYNFYKDVWDAQTLYRRICELEIGIGKTPPVATDNNVGHKWIPVSERLPENKGNYLGFTGSTSMVGYYKGNGIWWIWLKDVEGENLFTHWMHLPEPPKEAEG